MGESCSKWCSKFPSSLWIFHGYVDVRVMPLEKVAQRLNKKNVFYLDMEMERHKHCKSLPSTDLGKYIFLSDRGERAQSDMVCLLSGPPMATWPSLRFQWGRGAADKWGRRPSVNPRPSTHCVLSLSGFSGRLHYPQKHAGQTWSLVHPHCQRLQWVSKHLNMSWQMSKVTDEKLQNSVSWLTHCVFICAHF